MANVPVVTAMSQIVDVTNTFVADPSEELHYQASWEVLRVMIEALPSPNNITVKE